MPLYEFTCQKCSMSFEEVQGIKDPPLMFCPVCNGPVNRKFFDWDEKLAEFRNFNDRLTQAPMLPYILMTYFIFLILTGIAGGFVYKSVLGFLGLIIYVLGTTALLLIGSIPAVGPFIYIYYLGPLFNKSFLVHLGLNLTILSSVLYWGGFFLAILFSLITTLLVYYWLRTPVLWSFLDSRAREKLKYLLLIRLLHYEINPVWLSPNTYRTSLLKRWFGIKEYPAIRLKGINYYSKDIPVGPIREIEKRRQARFKSHLTKISPQVDE